MMSNHCCVSQAFCCTTSVSQDLRNKKIESTDKKQHGTAAAVTGDVRSISEKLYF